MSGVFILGVVFLAQSSIRDQLPERLQAIIAARTPDTSEIDWTVSWHGGRDDGLIERFETRTAGETVWQSNFGDANGYHPVTYRSFPPPDLSPEERRAYESPPESGAGTQSSLAYDAHIWRLPEADRPLWGYQLSRDTAHFFNPFDFAAAGLAPAWRTELNTDVLGLMKIRLEGFDSAEWSQYAQGRF